MEDYSNYFGEGAGISQNWATTYFLAFYDRPREDLLEKGMATYSSILALRIPWIEEPGRLPSRGLQRVGHH